MEKITTSMRLKALLSQRNLKQVDVLEMAKPYCEKYGVKLNKNDLSQYVSGRVVPGQHKLTILGLALNVSEAWLMGYDVPMERTNTKEITSDIKSAPKVDRDLQELYDMIARLDYGDRSEMKGAVKHMLKAAKYRENKE